VQERHGRYGTTAEYVIRESQTMTGGCAEDESG
jgi:hypothetical protein